MKCIIILTAMTTYTRTTVSFPNVGITSYHFHYLIWSFTVVLLLFYCLVTFTHALINQLTQGYHAFYSLLCVSVLS